jgi:signal transduction histidine kinase
VGGAAGLLHDELRGDQHELAGMVLERAGHLEHEIRSYRMLLDAERAELELHPEDVDPAALCSTLARLFTPQAQAAGVRLACAPGPNARLRTDKGILLRVLENLLKNAVEASPRGGTVTLGHESRGAGVRFFVSNESVMPAEVQGQVFQRFFSTKGPGRGLGTYGVRLLTENCLRGEVDFSSEPGQGTVFHVQLPETLDPGGPPPA